MATYIDGEDFWRQRFEQDRVLRRWQLQKLLKELENPGKRQSALRTAKCWFDANSAEELQPLLDAMPKPRTIAKRGKKGRRPWAVLEEEDAEWTERSVQRQEAADRRCPAK